MCLGISVGRRLGRFGELLNSIHDSVGEARLESVIHERLSVQIVIEVSNLEKERGHGGAAQNRQGSRADWKLPALNSFGQFIAQNIGGCATALPVNPVRHVPG